VQQAVQEARAEVEVHKVALPEDPVQQVHRDKVIMGVQV
jgi:hypothetical protein